MANRLTAKEIALQYKNQHIKYYTGNLNLSNKTLDHNSLFDLDAAYLRHNMSNYHEVVSKIIEDLGDEKPKKFIGHIVSKFNNIVTTDIIHILLHNV